METLQTEVMKTLEIVAELRKNIPNHFWKDYGPDMKIRLGMSDSAMLSFEISKNGRVAIFEKATRNYTSSSDNTPSHYSYETAEFGDIEMLIKEVQHYLSNHKNAASQHEHFSTLILNTENFIAKCS
ncbi:MAG TPA: hypothetical protein VK151_18025 [Fluviicola sp.]|nr:hypothetical protein [Fluviicola sp.]